MRKQTKVVAVASAAALLAIGASMTSFAATGWVEEDGQWYYYDKDGNRVENEWKKSGDNWYWLDSEEGGAMAVDKLIEEARSNTNEEERKELYKELAIKLDEINNNIPVYYSSINVGANKKVEGFVMDANGYHSLEKVKVAQ